MTEKAVRAKNLGALRQFQPSVYQKLVAQGTKTAPKTQELALEDGRRGHLSLRARDQEGDYYLHSLYDPVSEAKQFIEAETHIGKLRSGELNIVFVLGFGLGYLPEQLLEFIPANSTVVIVEQDLEALSLALTGRDVSSWIADARLRWVLEPNPVKAAMLCAAELPLHRVQGWKMLLPTPQVRRRPGYAKALLATLSAEMNQVFTATATELLRGPRLVSNELSNLVSAAEAPGISSVQGKWRGRPLILIAAGPSLEKQLPLLAQVQDRFLIVAVTQALPALRHFGIRPHVIVAIDFAISLIDFEGDDSKDALPEAPPFDLLAVDLACNPELLPRAPGRLIVGHASAQMENVFKALYGPKGIWNAGGSVATAAMSLAKILEAEPVILVGQDLALTDGRSHGDLYRHSATTLEDQQRLNPKGLSTVPGYHGDVVTTTVQFRSYLTWFEKFIGDHPEMVVINATEGGARITGAQPMPFKEAAECYGENTAISREVVAAWGNGTGSGVRNRQLPEALRRMAREALEIGRRCDRGLNSLEAWRAETGKEQKVSSKNSFEVAIAQYEAIVQSKSTVKFVIESMNRYEIMFANRALDELRSDPTSPVKADVFQFVFISFKESASNVAETFSELSRRLEAGASLEA